MKVLDELRVEILVDDDVDDERVDELLSYIDYQSLAGIIQGEVADPRGGTTRDLVPLTVKVYVDRNDLVSTTGDSEGDDRP